MVIELLNPPQQSAVGATLELNGERTKIKRQ